LTCCAAPSRTRPLVRALALAAAVLVGALAGACASTSSTPGQSAAAVTNPSLGPDYSTWMVGPVARMATAQEIGAFLALNDDAAAQEFIRQFWQRRNPTPSGSGNAVLAAFEQRAAQADRLYGEAGLPGHETPRGTIYVLYGRAPKIEFQDPPRRGESPIEVWIYGKNAGSGLDGQRPAEIYRWIKRGELTVPYSSIGPAPPPVVPLVPPEP